jgi:acetyl CoA:N6-hydroxylysine acetyl transferase
LPPGQALWAACYWLFARDPACQQLTWQLDQPPTEALLSGLLVSTEVAGEYRCERTLFWQLPQPGLAPRWPAAIRSKWSSVPASVIRCDR